MQCWKPVMVWRKDLPLEQLQPDACSCLKTGEELKLQENAEADNHPSGDNSAASSAALLVCQASSQPLVVL